MRKGDIFHAKKRSILGNPQRSIESELHLALYRSLGANPTPVPWPELYTALKTGVVVGINNHVNDIIPQKLHEVLWYYTIDEHMYQAMFLWMNNKFFTSLPDDLKRIVLDGLYHWREVNRAWNKEKNVPFLDTFKKIGGTVYLPTPEEKAQFVEACKPIRQWFVDKYGKEWVEMIEKAIADAKADIEKERAKNWN